MYSGLQFITTLFFCSNCSMFGQRELLPMVSVSLWHTLIRVVFWVPPYFPTWHNALGSSGVLLAPALEAVICSRSPGLFYWRMILEKKIGVLDVLVATEVLFLDAPQMAEQKVYMCILTYVCLCLWIFPYVFIWSYAKLNMNAYWCLQL